MARALVAQAAGDYLGMADALAPWQDDAPWTAAAADGRRSGGRCWPKAWSGRARPGRRPSCSGSCATTPRRSVTCSRLWPGWRGGWPNSGATSDQAREIYEHGEQTADAQSPVYTARLLLAHGRLLRRTGQRRPAIERLRQANDIYLALRATPFLERTEQELTACHLPSSPRTDRRTAQQ